MQTLTNSKLNDWVLNGRPGTITLSQNVKMLNDSDLTYTK